jgi:hypothetical protein
MGNGCSVLNPDCIAKKGVECPAYNSGVSCGDYDWLPLFQKMSGEEKDKWKQYMTEKCPQCPAFRSSMKRMITIVQKF